MDDVRLLDVATRLRITHSFGLGHKRRIGIPTAGSRHFGLLLAVRAY